MALRFTWPVAAVLSLCAPAFGAEPARLPPTSPWNLRYDEQACRLVRVFGTGDETVAFTIAKYGPNAGFELIVSGKDMKERGMVLRYRFLPDEEFEETEQPLFGTNSEGVTTWQFGGGLTTRAQLKALDALKEPARTKASNEAEMARRNEVDGFEVKSGMQRSFILATGKLDKPLAALDTCIDDLVTTWGYDPPVQKALSSIPEPKSNPGNWISSSDYPKSLVSQRIAGIVRFRLDVDATGLPTRCVVQAAYSDPAFEKIACDALMKKARFEPAKDATGASVPAFWLSSVKWIP